MFLPPGAALFSFIHNVVFDLAASVALRLEPFDDDVLLTHSRNFWCARWGRRSWQREAHRSVTEAIKHISTVLQTKPKLKGQGFGLFYFGCFKKRPPYCRRS